MKALSACLLACLISLGYGCATAQHTASANGWKLTWSEEFNKAGAPDPATWSYEKGFVRNKEAQYYTVDRRENARVEGGSLIITSRKEEYENGHYTSASLHTNGKKHFQHGRLEIRAQIPTGRGMWPAIWLLGTNIRQVGWPRCGEVDIMENVGYEPSVIHANVHTAKYNHTKGNGKGDKITLDKPWEGFHVYAVEWDEQRMDFFVDDAHYFTYENEGAGETSWPFDGEFYLILNSAIGGAWGGQKGIDDSIFPQEFKIDYVRYYQRESSVNDATMR
ncbi:MAG: family 16 glycosylhydrolase [bacterium]|nr:family 16 glycosylhydrolase [bacterium]